MLIMAGWMSQLSHLSAVKKMYRSAEKHAWFTLHLVDLLPLIQSLVIWCFGLVLWNGLR
jgi:hypothetical protein